MCANESTVSEVEFPLNSQKKNKPIKAAQPVNSDLVPLIDFSLLPLYLLISKVPLANSSNSKNKYYPYERPFSAREDNKLNTQMTGRGSFRPAN